MRYIYSSVFLLQLLACQPIFNESIPVLYPDTHSYANEQDVYCSHLNWKIRVDFSHKQLSGSATWWIENPGHASFIHLDTYDLGIEKVWVNNHEVTFHMTPFNKEMGAGLSVPLSEGDSIIQIQYHTGQNATALQWLSPEQTAGKKQPYLFTQCESIFARSLLPCQDLPARRITYDAEVDVPVGMMALMSAHNPVHKDSSGHYKFNMEIPVPTYLIALAVGDIEYQALNERSGVYTEPCMLQQAAKELEDIPAMMNAAEEIAGPYRWGTYDVLIAPPSFPIGGMENPRLTFATPTILAGDKSLVSLVAHEMAHSWSGNLVTNASWDDIWLNEGFTTYVERRIMERISGKDFTDMLWELGYQDLLSDLNDFGKNSADTRLHLDLTGRHPGEGFTNIPYEKGAVFLRMLEEAAGREKFDHFLNDYFRENAFIPMNSDQCMKLIASRLFDNNQPRIQALHIHEWIYESGLPANCPRSLPKRFAQVDAQRSQYEADGKAESLQPNGWSTHEWLQFLRKLKRPQDTLRMQALDQRFHLTTSGNSELADEWYRICIASSYHQAYPAMEQFLARVGRQKFLEPLYGDLNKTPEGRNLALSCFSKYHENYHPLTATKIQQILTGK